MNILEFLEEAILSKKDYCKLREEFHNIYAKGYIFSIRFGVSFFEELRDRLLTGKELDNHSEYDKSFNLWLRKTRKNGIRQNTS